MNTTEETVHLINEGRELHVVVIEDELTIAESLRVGLTYEGMRVTVASEGRSALQIVEEQGADLVILDLMLPDIDGMVVCRRLRAWSEKLPIIILTARGEVQERVKGLQLGADDYIVKPFSFDELLARVNAIFRRAGISRPVTVLQVAGLSLNLETREVTLHGRAIELTPTEFALLEQFMRHPRRVFTRQTLLSRVWGFTYVGDSNIVEVHISNLREKIGDHERKLIRTVYGVGYTLRPDDETMVA
ncbi:MULTISPECIES: response regulator transcription factor [Chloroflexus]|uniref:Two component transcriptional regulator, winged helix family n=1 Tax=Chloroflexus aggregans (strain MD-66 / DSM 9485) TaxID=326427 RepID=B8G869_CHLAD|nr:MULTISPECIES: response regulator transcription factor [Chloroflexus]ACL26123.1 two component transcriptional regulator, winged helix family [Chloroflexus aggregans DSM 9485]GIV87524.1 MAG: DNA-binding response regulator [Chloroflexus sp.]